MIQRIQSLFLLLGAVLVASPLFMEWAEVLASNGSIFSIQGTSLTIEEPEPFNLALWPVLFLSCLTLVGALIDLFLFKKRMLQARIAMLLALLSVFLPLVMYFYIQQAVDAVNGTAAYQLVLLFPFVAAILFYLARRRIIMDHLLVSSYDRIR